MKMFLVTLVCIIVAVSTAANDDVPQEIDWRDKGAISQVKDQGSCEGTFYFAATGLLESHYYILTGKQILLSEQNAVDCSLGFNNGCNGGGLLNTLDFVRRRGIDLEENYPYVGKLETCQDKNTDDLFQSIGYEMPRRDEEDMKMIVGTIGPVGVSFDGSNLISYTGGIYDDPNCNTNTQTHSGIIVGYGTTDDGVNYWTVKMPYGTNWGEEGYFRIARNINACGIANAALYPLL